MIHRKKKIAVLGGGSWGTALAVTFAARHDVSVWEFNAEQAAAVEQERRNKIFLPMVRLPRNVHFSNDMSGVISGADAVIFAVPSHVLRAVCGQAAGLITGKQYLVSVVKGIEEQTMLRMSEIIDQTIPSKKGVVALLGPTHAEEVARQVPSLILAASEKLRHSRAVQKLFITESFRVYASRDIVGAEIGAALKNVIAIAAGICDGLNYGDNTKAALITRGLAEIKRLGVKMGAKEDTFAGLSGMGDLIVTCMSRYSRNRKVGQMLGHGRKLEDILAEMSQVAEGVKNTRSALALAEKHGVELPIASAVSQVLFHDLPAKEIGHLLMTRAPKNEFY